MQIFINETSLDNQFPNVHLFNESIKLFISSIKRINEITKEKSLFRNKHFYFYKGLIDVNFESALKANPSINHAFVENFQKANPKSWQLSQVHKSDHSYHFSGREYCNTSVAEIAERKANENTLKGFLLNFSPSQFGNAPTIQVIKNDNEIISVDCNIDPDSIDVWLIANGFINPAEVYDEKSTNAPIDCQTVLRDEASFQRTAYPKNNGRFVFKRIGTNELWVVDSSPRHAGEKAHIEVFNESTCEHLGTSLYNEVRLNAAFRVKGRRINLA